MNRKTNLIIMKFAVVLMLLAMFLFFATDVQAAEFIAVCITMTFCTLVFFGGLTALCLDKLQPASLKTALLSAGIWLGVIVLCLILKLTVCKA